MNEQKAVLESVYSQALESEKQNIAALLFQPEALLLFERLTNGQTRLRKAWNTKYPEIELERIANAFGVSFD